MYLLDPSAAFAAAYVLLINLVHACRDLAVLWIVVSRVDPRRQRDVLGAVRRQALAGTATPVGRSDAAQSPVRTP